MVYVGIDLGGTNIAVGVVSETGSILAEAGAKTLADRPYQAIVRDMAELVRKAVAKARLTLEDVRAIGIGIPGVVDDQGVVFNCTNLGWVNVPLRAEFDIPLRTTGSGSVEDGTRTPPGHSQKENTPLSSTCSAKEYSAAGIPGSHCPW